MIALSLMFHSHVWMEALPFPCLFSALPSQVNKPEPQTVHRGGGTPALYKTLPVGSY